MDSGNNCFEDQVCNTVENITENDNPTQQEIEISQEALQEIKIEKRLKQMTSKTQSEIARTDEKLEPVRKKS